MNENDITDVDCDRLHRMLERFLKQNQERPDLLSLDIAETTLEILKGNRKTNSILF